MESRLKLFANIVDAGSFTLAARQLRVSQPALSSSVKKLETELGDSLLDRASFTLTPAGELAYASGKRLSTDEQNLQTALAELAGRKPSLRIGMIDSMAEILFVHGTVYDKITADTTLALTIDNSSRLVERLAAGDIDVAFIVADVDYPPDLTVRRKLGDEPLVLVTAPNGQELVTRASRTGTLRNFLSYNAGSRTQRLIQRAAASGGLVLDTRFYATSPSIMLAMALAGKGIAALPYHMVSGHIERGELLPIALNGSHIIRRPLVALTRRGRQLPSSSTIAANAASDSLRALTAQARRSRTLFAA